ncbi:hypothetical protein PHYBOEH_000526 [Phytophthora boehmeriae]|uniref:PH domain-containing protein n=1 Tax=Phytophthora boehmeriae TaxID=109152 RepID=A0A8T1VCK3_9STRA|nr:hypothetical protein PHYBOEH_000526 [Phytophthora boehmeriae]
MLDIPLDPNANMVDLVSPSEKQASHLQFAIRYGPRRRRRLTLRTATQGIYQSWRSAIETALTMVTFVAIPAIATKTSREPASTSNTWEPELEPIPDELESESDCYAEDLDSVSYFDEISDSDEHFDENLDSDEDSDSDSDTGSDFHDDDTLDNQLSAFAPVDISILNETAQSAPTLELGRQRDDVPLLETEIVDSKPPTTNGGVEVQHGMIVDVPLLEASSPASWVGGKIRISWDSCTNLDESVTAPYYCDFTFSQNTSSLEGRYGGGNTGATATRTESHGFDDVIAELKCKIGVAQELANPRCPTESGLCLDRQSCENVDATASTTDYTKTSAFGAASDFADGTSCIDSEVIDLLDDEYFEMLENCSAYSEDEEFDETSGVEVVDVSSELCGFRDSSYSFSHHRELPRHVQNSSDDHRSEDTCISDWEEKAPVPIAMRTTSIDTILVSCNDEAPCVEIEDSTVDTVDQLSSCATYDSSEHLNDGNNRDGGYNRDDCSRYGTTSGDSDSDTPTGMGCFPSTRRVHTPFERLLLRQLHQLATADLLDDDGEDIPVDVSAAFAPESDRDHDSRSDEDIPSDNHRDDMTDDTDGIESVGETPSAEYRPNVPLLEEKPPARLTVGQINTPRMNEITRFAACHTRDSVCKPKKTLVIKRIHEGWLEVARFAFRPNAVAARKAGDRRQHLTIGRIRSVPAHQHTLY